MNTVTPSMNENQDINQLAEYIHKEVNHKWWHDERGNPIDRNAGELLMLVITELAEAMEGIRKNLMDDHLPHRRMEEVEMADAEIRLLDFSAGFKISLQELPVVLPSASNNKAEQILWICGGVFDAYHHRKSDNIGSKLSFVVRAIKSYCAAHDLDLVNARMEKIEYNRTRLDHTHEARKLANGKKF